MPTVPWDVHYDRHLDPDFLQHFLTGGFASSLTAYTRLARFPLDLQPRRNPKTNAQHVTLYAGLTAVLNVVRRSQTTLSLSAHDTFVNGGHGFELSWMQPADEQSWKVEWSRVEDYLESVIPSASLHYGTTEGAVQAAVSVFNAKERVMVDREVALHFKDTATKSRIMAELMAPLVAAAASAPSSVPGKRPTKFGGECDLLALDDQGRVLAVEVKPKNVGTIRWSGLQSMMYARLFRRWVDEPHHEGWSDARDVLLKMLEQRQFLNPALKGPQSAPQRLAVVPIVVVPRGANATYVDDLLAVQAHVESLGLTDEPVEVYEASITGKLRVLGR